MEGVVNEIVEISLLPMKRKCANDLSDDSANVTDQLFIIILEKGKQFCFLKKKKLFKLT
jgi:hypothetical protein